MAIFRAKDLKPGERYRVLDANGLEWGDITECDTETGYIQQVARDEAGRPLVHPNGGELLRSEAFVAAPLILIPIPLET